MDNPEKIEIFSGQDSAKLQEEINEWIKKAPVRHIESRQLSTCVTKTTLGPSERTELHTTVAIFYRTN